MASIQSSAVFWVRVLSIDNEAMPNSVSHVRKWSSWCWVHNQLDMPDTLQRVRIMHSEVLSPIRQYR